MSTPAPAPTSPPPPPSPESNDTTSPPPPPATPSTSLDPTTSSSPPPPPLPPLPPVNGGMATGTLIALIVGIGIGGVIVLVVVAIFVILRRRRRRDHGLLESTPGVPPQGPKDDPFAGTPQHWQPNAPSPTDNIVSMLPKPTSPLQIASNTQLSPGYVPTHPAPPSTSSSLGSEKPPLSLSPGMSFGFTKSTFSYEELAMATDGFSKANLLGQGGFGYVHKGVLPNGKQVAIKQLKAGSRQGEREFQAEVEIISRVHHKHLVSLVGYCISGVQRMLVYEFVPNSTLEFHLHGKERPTMSWAIRMKIALGSAKGLAYLHEDCQPKIIHRDIKAANILLDYNFEAKVADFGLAKFSSDVDTHVSTRVMGTFGYLAPEYASSGKLTEKSDVFSFGVMLLELITGRRPVDKTQSFTDDSMVDWARPLLTQALESGNFDTLVDPRLQDYNSSEMARMVACAAVCVRHSARRRPQMSQIVRALEGNISLDDLNEGIRPGHSGVYSPFGSSDYDTSQYNDDLKNFRKMALQSQEHSISELTVPTSKHNGATSESGLHPSSPSTEGQQTTEEMKMGEMKKDTKDFCEGS